LEEQETEGEQSKRVFLLGARDSFFQGSGKLEKLHLLISSFSARQEQEKATLKLVDKRR